MRKRTLILTLLMAVFMIGCGNEDIKESNETQIMESEEDFDIEIDELDAYMKKNFQNYWTNSVHGLQKKKNL